MTNDTIRLTTTRIAVLKELLAATEDRPLWGMEIAYRTNLEQSTVSSVLRDLRNLGWAESWIDENGEGGANRRYHELTPVGYQQTMKVLLARTERRRKAFRNYI